MFKIEDLIRAHARMAARGGKHIEHIVPAGELFGIDPIEYNRWKSLFPWSCLSKPSLVIKYIRGKK